MTDGTGRFEINCPCCGALMVIDAQTQSVLRHEAPKRVGASFEEMLKDVGESKKKTESKLARAMEEQRKRDQILEKKFREAVKKAETSDEAPPKPFDFD